jgi:hypothetical protein
MSRSTRCRSVVLAAVTAALAVAPSAAAAKAAFINRFNTITNIASAVPVSGPAAGDQNPYGVSVVPNTIGKLVRGNVLVSNFNNSQNFQGTGSSIVQISPSGKQKVFAVIPPPTATPATGLTTALVALKNGDVVVGSLPAPGGDGTMATAGALTVLGPDGHVLKTITASDINGPWDMTADDDGHNVTLFVTNVLAGTVAAGEGNVVNQGTVIRIHLKFPYGASNPVVGDNDVIGTGFANHLDPGALVVGPTGVGLGDYDTLYVADSVNNRIAAIPNASTREKPFPNGGNTVSANGSLNDPLGLTIAPNGDIVTANGADGNIVETTPGGNQLAVKTLIPDGGGDLFGITLAPYASGLYFVNDATPPTSPANSLELLH